jgi:hypothetical protein
VYALLLAFHVLQQELQFFSGLCGVSQKVDLIHIRNYENLVVPLSVAGMLGLKTVK